MSFYTKPIGLDVPPELAKQLPPVIVSYVRAISWPTVAAALMFPGMLVKQVISVVQFYKAALSIADLDREERYVLQKQKQKKAK